MRVLKRGEFLWILSIAIAAGLVVCWPMGSLLRGWTIDAETTLRWRTLGDRSAEPSTTVVVALDEQTYGAPPFKGSPTLTWTGEIGRVVDAALAGGAKVVGFDIVFANSIEESAIRFRDGQLGTALRGFDRDYLRALANAARAGKIVLGEIATPDGVVRPSPGQQLAVGGRANIRALNVQTDADDVVRRVPVVFKTAAGPVPSLSLELASRSLGQPPEFAANGDVKLGSWRIPTAQDGSMVVAFSGPNQVPVYSLADLAYCLDRPATGYFQKAFAGKIVLIGLDVGNEDQLLTATRFLPGSPGASAERCSSPSSLSPARRRTISGIFLQALAVENLVRHEALIEPPQWANAALATAAAALAGFAALAARGGKAAGAAAAAVLLWLCAAIFAHQRLHVLPLVEPLAASLLGAIGGTLVRVVGVDREQRFLRRAFGLYLAPAMVERISASGSLPALGGETREVTLFFSDVVGFSTLAETMTPTEVVSLMNAYLSAMSEEIERAGGFVDKFVGDAIVAIFGAPAFSASHPAEAVAAAIACRDRLAAFNLGRPVQLRHRIGLNAGEALVGNVGSLNRFNYTALGDSVNLAARLEQANASYDTFILASESVKAQACETFDWREVDTIRVPGRSGPVTIFEPLARHGEATDLQRRYAEAYAEGLAAWRKRDFVEAERCFSLFPRDAPAAAFLARCRRVIAEPPDAHWTPVNTLRAK